ncbi:hypothetical protein LBC_01530 [Campylobacter sp. 19-13652]|nr:hypothetical protein LBC_01530 [Campylobacter sp. 19-13652]
MLKEAGYDFKTLYIGGGTTLINEGELEKTLRYIKDEFSVTQVSAETDPSHIKPEQLQRFKGLIDRLSVGVQSFNDETLKRVARYDKFGSASVIRQRIEQALGIFPELSVDLIFNLPKQSADELRHDIEVVKQSGAQQVTFYPLMRSNITTKAIERSLGAKMKDNEREYYDIICEQMSGYERTNAWAFALRPSKLKDEYVGAGVDFIGAGSGAFSFSEGALLVNAFDLEEYTRRVSERKSTVLARCEFAPRDRVRYRFVTALFDGAIDVDKFNAHNACNLLSYMAKELSMLRLAGAVSIRAGRVEPTHFGRYLSLVMMREFYSGMDRVRAAFRDKKVPEIGLQKIF